LQNLLRFCNTDDWFLTDRTCNFPRLLEIGVATRLM
jgi:hypothetical protein